MNYLVSGSHSESQRLDTLEEMSEPASSDYWQPDSIGSKGSSTNVAENMTTGDTANLL